ncbi:MAG TPA: anthrax toxin-like adenylyl cyclase domain-containing protein [Stellaceae bacterium]|jgi:hypothetical protein|nr:anthrax toxin-like adenylyl cyclase domain-containing protein [Stellaceae bacterium]
MTVILGLPASFAHNQNGMTRQDMVACGFAASELNEVIVFRSTGPWAKRWIERGYPTKNFHVKGKSSDWGPHAGLVPYDGTYSKVGYDTGKAAKGTQANEDGLHSGFAGRAPLVLTREQIDEQENRPEGRPPRTALFAVAAVQGSTDLMLTARRSGDGMQVSFLARRRADGRYDILVYPPGGGGAGGKGLVSNNIFTARDRGDAAAVPLEVMTSNEIGANGLPLTGDYDLFAVCPPWADYGSLTSRPIVKPGIALHDRPLNKGLAFRAGVGLDNVLDARLATGGTAATDFLNRAKQYRTRYIEKLATGRPGKQDTYNMIFAGPEYAEHADMGNLTPRILRCINELNVKMGATGDGAALRRVHHNAESHRFRTFGALTAEDMVTMKDGEAYGDGFPLTVFQPRRLAVGPSTVARYGEVCTIECLAEFQVYARELAESGYYVPKNWVWQMHAPPRAHAN